MMDDLHQALLTAFLAPIGVALAITAGIYIKDWWARSRAH